jgi:pimeloyl-ACP methyl ester carboxylesterase
VVEVKRRFQEEGRGDEYTDKAWSPPSVTYSKLKTGGSLFQEAVAGGVEMAKHWHPPGVFGSGLQAATSLLQKRFGANCEAVRVGKTWEGYGPKLRQVLLNPETVEVDDDGFLPRFVVGLDEIEGRPAMEVARERGWGTVHWDSYWKLLKFLEHNLNGEPPFDAGNIQLRRWRVESRVQPGFNYGFIEGVIPTEAEVEKTLGSRFPVHAMGYNWTQSNLKSAKQILDQIESCIGGYQSQGYTCTQVILVTHSMGGLVARVASQLDKGKNRILGVVHGVMPATGAPDAYRTMVAGAEPGNPLIYKDLLTVFAALAGKTAAESTPVMANAPGALELLPSHLYPTGWLKVERDTADGSTELLFALPEREKNDPYTIIYKENDAWWRLVDPELLDPAGMAAKECDDTDREAPWGSYIERINSLAYFHSNYLNANQYHLLSFAFFGKKEKTLAGVHWRISMDSFDLSVGGIRQAKMFHRNIDGVCEIKAIMHDALSGGKPNIRVTRYQVAGTASGVVFPSGSLASRSSSKRP